VHRQSVAALLVVFEQRPVLWIKAGASKNMALELAEHEEAEREYAEKLDRETGPTQRTFLSRMRQHHSASIRDIRAARGTPWPDTAFGVSEFAEGAEIVTACPKCHRKVILVVSNGSVQRAV